MQNKMDIECPICHQKFRAQGFQTHLKAEIKKLALELSEESLKKYQEDNMRPGNPEMRVKKHVFAGTGKYCQDCGHLAMADCHCLFPWEVELEQAPDPLKELKEIIAIMDNFIDNVDTLMISYKELMVNKDEWIIKAKRWASKVIELQELIARGD